MYVCINSSFIASERTTLASERIWVSENDDDGSGSGWFKLPFFFFFSLPLVVFSKFFASFDTPWVFIWFRLIVNGWSHCWAGASSVLGSFTIHFICLYIILSSYLILTQVLSQVIDKKLISFSTTTVYFLIIDRRRFEGYFNIFWQWEEQHLRLSCTFHSLDSIH